MSKKITTTMKKALFVCLLSFLTIISAKAQDYSSYYQDLPISLPIVKAPQIPDYSVNLKDFGGVGDGVSLNTEAFDKAIDFLSSKGGGHLIVPQGIWLTGLIVLKSNIDLHLEQNAIIMASPDKSLFIREINGKKDKKSTPLLTASNAINISITGQGIIDGNGAHWRPVKRSKVSDVEWKEFLSMGGTLQDDNQLWYPHDLNDFDNISDSPQRLDMMRAHLVRFKDCENILLSGVTLENSPKFHLVPNNCKNLIIDGITLRCPWNAQNGDAIDIGNCKDVLIINNTIDAGDDGICMKGGVGPGNSPCENILIQDNTVYHAHGGFVIGSEFCGGMFNIIVKNNSFCGTDTGLRFKSGVGRGGTCKNIFISDIFMTDIKDEAIIFQCTYVDNKVSGNERPNPSKEPQTLEFVPEFTDIHISDVVVRNCKTAISAHTIPDYNCIHDIDIDNCTFFYTKKDIDKDEKVELNITNSKFLTFEK